MSRTVVIASRARSCARFRVSRLAVAGSGRVEERGGDILEGRDLDSLDAGVEIAILNLDGYISGHCPTY